VLTEANVWGIATSIPRSSLCPQGTMWKLPQGISHGINTSVHFAQPKAILKAFFPL